MIKPTETRQQWAKSRGGVTFKGSPLTLPVSIERRYEKELIKLVQYINRLVMEEIDALYGSKQAEVYFAQDSVSGDAKRVMSKVTKAVDEKIKDEMPSLVARIMASVNSDGKTKLTASVKEMSGGINVKLPSMPGDMKDIFAATVEENVSLIKSIGDQYLSSVNGIIMRSITEGESGVEKQLREQFGVTKRRARLIATDQVRKAYNNFNIERCKAIGITKGIWIHTAGSKEPRPKHRDFNGKEFDLEKGAPVGNNNEYVKPGQEINCRCIYKPVIDFGGDD